MGIKSDLEEFRELWNHGSWWLRGIAVLLFFVSLGPIASLADTVFQLRGFIRDGINFYDFWIKNPFRSFMFSIFGLKLSHDWGSFLIFCILCSSAFVREKFTSEGFWNALQYGIVQLSCMIFCLFILDWYDERLLATGTAVGWRLFMIVLSWVALVWWYSVGLKNKTIYYASIFAPILFVGIVAAISYGLSKQLE
jgi:hypothetical protein